jgi:uncharacterized protein (TIGR03089 family)
MPAPERLFSDLLASAPSRPFVTYYDEATGERSELSAASLANWVAKTHHLLGDELGLGVGDQAFVELPAHWISVPIVLGCFTAGLILTDLSPLAEVGFVSDVTVASALGVPDIFAIAPAAAARGFGDAPPALTRDYVTAVRPQADRWAGVRFGADADDMGINDISRAAVGDWAQDRASALGLATGARVLVVRDWAGPADWVDTLLAPLAVGGSVVYVRNTDDPAVLARRAAQERVTVRID